MVYLKYNDKQFLFQAKFSPLNFSYDVINSGLNFKSGTLFMKDFIIDKEIYDYINQNDFKTISIKNNKYEFEISKYAKNIIKFLNKEGEFYLVTFVLEFDDVFKFYELFVNEIQKFFNKPSSSYDCLSTGNVCNLKCPYCTQGLEHNKYEFKNNIEYFIYRPFIKQIVSINNIFGYNYHTVRLMGGETFYNFESFQKAFEELLIIKDNKINNLWIYTNYTINVDKFLDYIDYMLTKIDMITIIITSDSLNHKYSLRISNEELMNTYINNIQKTCDKYKDNERVIIATNNMYLNYEETMNTVTMLYKMGLNYIQLAYDEFSNMEEGNKIRFELHQIFNDLEKYNIPRLKENLGKSVWLHFSVSEGEVEIYRSKLCLGSTYNPSFLNYY